MIMQLTTPETITAPALKARAVLGEMSSALPVQISFYPMHSAEKYQPNPTLCITQSSVVVREESYLNDQENADRCTSARRNTGCAAQWKQN